MGKAVSTCWAVIEGAAAGSASDRETFARRYLPVVRAYFGARWRWSPLKTEVDDAVQDVFMDCFRQGGVLERADRERPGGFHAFLYGVVRIVALRFETRRQRRKVRASGGFDADVQEADEASLAEVFDRAWAQQIMREAADLLVEQAGSEDPARQRRVELLQLRFREGLPIREVAARWEEDAAVLHRQYAKARREFRAALAEVVAFHHPGSGEEIEGRCEALLEHL